MFGFGGSNAGKTLRPRKSTMGNKGLQLRQHIDATLGRGGDIMEAVQLPRGEELREWLAVNVVDFYNEACVLYCILDELCTDSTCAVMSAGAKYEYLWADGVKVKKPIKLSAPQYINHLFDWIESQIDDNKVFPQEIGSPFPADFDSVVRTIFKRLFRVYAHIYHSHFKHICELKAEPHLNTCFKHFIFFTIAHNMVDEKIRIWGAHGQGRFEEARVCLLNASATGSEALKNLVLGGIAAFTIVDGCKVTERDLGNNFFVEANALGSPRAKVVCDLLLEMNEAVAGGYIEETPESLLESNTNFLSQFTLVIGTQMKEQDATRLDDWCRKLKVPLLLARSYGLAGYLRASLPEHLVIESKPDSITDDLRLNDPFEELTAFCRSFDLKALDSQTYGHLPYAVLLIHAVDVWKAANGGRGPSPRDGPAFKKHVALMKRTQEDGIPLDQVNLDEAIRAAFHIWAEKGLVSSDVRSILHDPSAVDLSLESDDYWVVASALRSFVEAEGHLPLEGSIPDMHALTDLYLGLQRVYREKAESDILKVESLVNSILASIGRSGQCQGAQVPQSDQDASPAPTPSSRSSLKDTIRLMCKHSRNLRVVRWPSLSSEASGGGSSGAGGAGIASALSQALCLGGETGDPRQQAGSIYVLLKAADRFFAAHGRYPGSHHEGHDSSEAQGLIEAVSEEDVPALKTLASSVLADMGVPAGSVAGGGGGGGVISDDMYMEMCRFGAGEIHVVASIVGGMASQEAIKIITRQFTPAQGTLIYNGIECTTTVFA